MPKSEMRRMACQIAAQLPDNQGEALAVLEYVREIVLNLGGGWDCRATGAVPIQLFAQAQTNQAEALKDETGAPTGPPNIANQA